MAKYYTQHFTGSKSEDIHAYGPMDDHNHDRSNQFTKDVKDFLVSKGWERKGIRETDFKSNQNEPTTGKAFKWNGSKYVRDL